MKKIICLILIFMLSVIPNAYANTFTDLDEDYSWAMEAITEFNEKGIIKGYPDGTFKPEKNITNSETAKITVLVFGESENDVTYNDVTSDKWYYSYVKSSKKYFLRDVRDKNFRPENNTLRKEVAYALYIGAGFDKLDKNYNEALNINEKYALSVSYLNKIDILKGYPDGTLGEDREITRAEFATLIKRVNDIANNTNTDNKTEENVSGYPRPHSFFYVVTDVMMALDESEEAAQKICGYINGEYEENFIYDDTDVKNRLGVKDKIEVNDVIYILKDYFGKIMYVVILEDADYLKNVTSYNSFYIYNSKYTYIFGKVESIRNGNVIEIIKNEDEEITEAYRIKDDAAFYLLENDEIELSKISKIKEDRIKEAGDYILTLIIDEEIADVLIIR